MKIFKIIFIGLILHGWAATSSAAPMTLSDTITFTDIAAIDANDGSNDLDSHGWGTVNKLDPFIDWLTWTHDFTFAPAYDILHDATLTVSIRDDSNSRLDFWEFAFGYAEDGTWDFGEVNTGAYSYDVDVSFLTDGEFSIKLVSLLGDFYVDQSVLSINYDYQEQIVSESAVWLLFPLITLMLVGIKRRI